MQLCRSGSSSELRTGNIAFYALNQFCVVVVGGRGGQHKGAEIFACKRSHGRVHLVYQVEIVQSRLEPLVINACGVVFVRVMMWRRTGTSAIQTWLAHCRTSYCSNSIKTEGTGHAVVLLISARCSFQRSINLMSGTCSLMRWAIAKIVSFSFFSVLLVPGCNAPGFR